MTHPLVDYVREISIRGDCTCGKCIDSPQNPIQPNGHTVDVYYFKVAVKPEADADTLKQLIIEHKGEFNDCDPLDGMDHSYIELGAWIGDQGTALTLMGLGQLLGLWQIITPNIFPIPKELKDMLAGQGFLSIIGPKGLEEEIAERKRKLGEENA
jgi:hypothetical protein